MATASYTGTTGGLATRSEISDGHHREDGERDSSLGQIAAQHAAEFRESMKSQRR